MASKDEISDAANKLREMTPAPMNSMLEKQPKEDAIKKRDKRRSIVAADVLPTTPGAFYTSKCFFFCFVLLFFKWELERLCASYM